MAVAGGILGMGHFHAETSSYILFLIITPQRAETIEMRRKLR
jgi:hypothetical protein